MTIQSDAALSTARQHIVIGFERLREELRRSAAEVPHPMMAVVADAYSKALDTAETMVLGIVDPEGDI